MRGFNAGAKTHIVRSPSRDVQPDQLSSASGGDIDDPRRSLGVEHDAPGHLRLDGHVAVDAERRTLEGGRVTKAPTRTALVGTGHGIVELVGARYQHDPAHRAIAECRTELARADRVPQAGLQRRRGRRRGRRQRRGRRGRRLALGERVARVLANASCLLAFLLARALVWFFARVLARFICIVALVHA
eukprot:scaffold88852_cov71-Phaeocystis_antarctica.AAC.4